jgi:hypothetical protein
LGSLAVIVLNAWKAGPKALTWLFVVVFVGAVGVSVFSRVKPNEHAMAPPQTATASGSSTIIQAGGNVTIINPDVRKETERARLSDESDKLADRLAHEYPLGYALIGFANGNLVWAPNVKRIQIAGDWENWRVVIDKSGKPFARLIVSKLEIDGFKIEDSSTGVPFYNTAVVPIDWVMVRGVHTYFEVIDTEHNVFAIGFSDKSPNP